MKSPEKSVYSKQYWQPQKCVAMYIGLSCFHTALFVV